jgi:hypothetical protein
MVARQPIGTGRCNVEADVHDGPRFVSQPRYSAGRLSPSLATPAILTLINESWLHVVQVLDGVAQHGFDFIVVYHNNINESLRRCMRLYTRNTVLLVKASDSKALTFGNTFFPCIYSILHLQRAAHCQGYMVPW